MRRRALLGGLLATPLAQARATTLKIVGSDSLSTALAAWSEALRRVDPSIDIEVQSSGSASGALALVQGTADLSPMSRALSDAERQAFERRYGYPPRVLSIARDALAVICAQRTALDRITLQELDQVYSRDRRCAFAPRIQRFAELADGRGNPTAIEPIGRNFSSGSYAYFRQVALCDGHYASHYRALPGAASVSFAVAQSSAALGVVGLGFVTAGVRALAIGRGSIANAIAPSQAQVASGRYPLARDLKLYFNVAPGAALPSTLKAFLALALSPAGQAIAARGGLVPLGESEREQMAISIGA
jgi:phosphate transport system substrate-binding protein